MRIFARNFTQLLKMKYGHYYPVLLKCHKMTKIYLYCFNQDNPPISQLSKHHTELATSDLSLVY